MKIKQKILLQNDPEKFANELKRLIDEGHHIVPNSVQISVSTSAVSVVKNSEEDEDEIVTEVVNNTEYILFAVLETPNETSQTDD